MPGPEPRLGSGGVHRRRRSVLLDVRPPLVDVHGHSVLR